LAPAPQVARRGHRAPGARSRLKAGAPSPSKPILAEYAALQAEIARLRAEVNAQAQTEPG
jgi:hypothetical protein